MQPSTSSLLIAVLLGSVSLSACATDPGAEGEDELETTLDDGKADGVLRYRLQRSEAGYRPLNQGLDEWEQGLIRVTPNDDGSWLNFGPWYKVTPDTSSPTWWRMDVRPSNQGDERKRVGFYVLWRQQGESAWQVLAPEVEKPDGTTDRSGFFNSFKMGYGTLQVSSPAWSGTSTESDFIWDDIRPELAFAPVVWETSARMAGVTGFEISITEEE